MTTQSTTILNGTTYTVETVDGTPWLTSPTGKLYVGMPTYREPDQYLVLPASRRGKGLGYITWAAS